MLFISIFTSANWPFSVKEFSDALLNWYVPLFACILIIRSEEDVILVLKIIAVAVMIDAFAGVIEWVLQRRYYFDIFPRGMLDSMLANNPTLAAMYYKPTFRNGLYRSASIYSIPLSFGELGAMAGPIAAYFILHGRGWRDWTLGALTGIGSLLALFCSGARGGYTGFLAAMPVMGVLWVIRNSKLKPHSLASGIVGVIFAISAICVASGVLFWPGLHDMVIGDEYEGGSSTEARFIQWNMARPVIISNPVTGHGMGTSGQLVPYGIEAGFPSIDSYVITLLVEQGVPGLLFFFGMIVVGIWITLRVYLIERSEGAAVAAPLAGCLIAFVTYRFALSQIENHTLLFMIIGLIFAVGRISNRHLWLYKPFT
jgi:O-antigen ligase